MIIRYLDPWGKGMLQEPSKETWSPEPSHRVQVIVL